MKLFKKAKKGFTLVELVVVIAVIAILAAVSVGAYFGVTDSANRSKLEQEAKQTFEAIRLISLADPENNQNLGIDGLTLDTTDDGVAEFTNDLMYATGQTYTVSLEEKPQEGITGKTVVLYKNFLDLGTSNVNGSNQTYKSFNYYTNEVKSYAANVNLINGKIEIISDEFEITPPAASTAVTGVSLNATSHEMLTGETYALSATVTPDTATDKSVSWSSNDTSVVTVNNGVVTAVGAGTATVTVTTTDGNKTASCTFKVKDPVIDAEAIGITTTAPENFYVGDTPITLEAQITPADTTNKTITWSSSAPGVASVVAETGVVTPVSAGTVVITAKTHNGKTHSITIVVKQHAAGVELNSHELNMHVGDNDIQLTATIRPADTSNTQLTWESDNEFAATVDSTGKVHAVGNGTANIIVKTADGDKTDTCVVNVKTYSESVLINEGAESISLNEGQNTTLSAVVSPNTSSYKDLEWESSNPGAATVDSTGKVTAIAKGETIITVKTNDSTPKTDTIKVNVIRPVGDLTLDKSSETINVGDELQLIASFNPANPTNPNVEWESSNPGAATVDSTGKVTAIAKGKTTITVTSVEDPGKSASCEITVIKPIENITLSQSSLSMFVGDALTEENKLTYSIEPSDHSSNVEEGVWSSTNPAVAEVSNGIVRALTVGSAEIKFTLDGHAGTCTVTVEKAPVPVTGVTIISPVSNLNIGSTTTLTANVEPADADNKNVSWGSDHPEIASVNADTGVVTAHTKGSATITVTTEEGGFTASTTIEVVGTAWKIVENVDELQDGDVIVFSMMHNGQRIIFDSFSNKALRFTENAGINLTNNIVLNENMPEGALKYKLSAAPQYNVGNTPAYKLFDGENYLFAGPSTDLQLKSPEEDVASQVFTFDQILGTTYNATISSHINGSPTGRALRINDSYIRNYGANYGDPQILKCIGDLPNIEIPEIPELTSYEIELDSKTTSLEVKASATINYVTNSKVPSNAYDPEIKSIVVVSGSEYVSVDGLTITAVAEGTAQIKAVDSNGKESSILTINVVNSTGGDTGGDDTPESGEKTRGWHLITDKSELSDGDRILFVDTTNLEIPNTNNTKSEYFDDCATTITLSSDGTMITSSVPSDALEIVLNNNGSYWNLTTESGSIGATAVKKVNYNNTGDKDWTIEIDEDGNATIQNKTTTYGRFLHNAQSNRFTTYTSATNASMLLPKIYKYYEGNGELIEPTPVTLESIVVTPESITVNKGETSNESIAVSGLGSDGNPFEIKSEDIIITSNNTNIATITNNKVVGVSQGETTVTVTVKRDNNSDLTKVIDIYVIEESTDKILKETEISFSDTSLANSDKNVWTKDGIVFNGGSGGYSNPLRVYANSTVIITGNEMTKIVFNVNSGKTVNGLKNALTDTSKYSVSQNSYVITITFINPVNTISFKATEQFRLDSVVVSHY